MNERQVILGRKVNGYSFSVIGAMLFSSEFRTAITNRIQELRPVFLAANADNKDMTFGSRFTDDERVLTGILSGIMRFYPDWPSIDNVTMENVERHQIDFWVHDGLRDCAETDHWYMYEKQYE
jgi:hypothetical protein